MKKDEKQSGGARKNLPAITEELIIKNKKKLEERKKASKDGKMFWERNKE